MLIIIYLKTRYSLLYFLVKLILLETLSTFRFFLHSVFAGTCFVAASPAECRAGGFAPEHVRGHGGEEERPPDGAGDL